MKFLIRLKFPVVAGFLLVLVLFSCEEDLTTIGEGVISGTPFTTGKKEYDVFSYNKKIEAVQTNKLPVYQLGVFNDPVYGKTVAKITTQVNLSIVNPTFGTYSQETEDGAETDTSVSTIEENETVTGVYLYIPYLTKAAALRDADSDGVDDEFDTEPDDATNDSDLDGLTNIQEKNIGTNPLNNDTDGDGILDAEDDDIVVNVFPKQVEIDSIYGDRSIDFRLKVTRSTYFLRDLDPTANFQETQEYFSNQDFSTGFSGEIFFDGDVAIDDMEMLFFNEDDLDTEDEDESEVVKERLSPGIWVELDDDALAFFQENILDKEGQSELLSTSNFKDFFRGLHLSINEDNNKEHLLLLDITQARIDIKYNYDKVDTNSTTDDTTDDTVVKEESSFSLQLLNSTSSGIIGNAVNTLINDAYPSVIADQLGSEEKSSRIYLRGGAGVYGEINLFDEVNGRVDINEIKANNWIINEANLVFYVDRNALGNNENHIEPPRLYLYNAETKAPLYNLNTEVSEVNSSLGVYQNYDGILEKSDDKGLKYTIKITDYINDIIVRDSTNATLALALSSDIRIPSVSSSKLANSSEEKLPIMAAINPLGTIIYGGSHDDNDEENKTLKLEIYYTESN